MSLEKKVRVLILELVFGYIRRDGLEWSKFG